MYMGAVCLVLFDARGSETVHYDAAALGLASLLMLVQYVPALLHRPQLVDGLCEDLLHIATHAAAVCTIASPVLRYACALHSTCFLLQNRLRPSVRLATCPVGVVRANSSTLVATWAVEIQIFWPDTT